MVIDVRQLRYFLAVAAERSFTRGAEQLHMAQAPLSKRIQELEEQLGVQLFDRESRPISLTPAGHLLREEALHVVHRMDQLQATMRRFIAAERPRFVVGLVPSTLYAGLPELVARFRAQTPGLDVALAEMDSSEQMAALKDGRIDVGFDRIVLEDPLVTHMLLREEPLVVALPAHNALLDAPAGVPLAAVAQLPLILYPGMPPPSYADLILSFFHERDMAPASIVSVRELQTALAMVAAGAGACIIPESVRHHAHTDIGYAPLEEKLTAPFLLRRRAGPMPQHLKALLALYERGD